MRGILCVWMLFLACLGYIPFCFSLDQMEEVREDCSFVTHIQGKVLQAIEQFSPDRNLSSEDLAELREKMTITWNLLIAQGTCEACGLDKEIRSIFVALQGVIEHVLARELNHSVISLQGIIHTPMPATPLCTRRLLIPKDSQPFHAHNREKSLRTLLASGGVLYVVYPKDGIKNRTEQQRSVYQEELRRHPETLIDMPLACTSMPLDLSGATYFFKDNIDQSYVFSIKMTQARDSEECVSAGLWWGALNAPYIQARLHTLDAYMEQYECEIFHLRIIHS